MYMYITAHNNNINIIVIAIERIFTTHIFVCVSVCDLTFLPVVVVKEGNRGTFATCIKQIQEYENEKKKPQHI